jgi:pimeloyl-ACP methyl ester carboxylesterase
MGVIPPHQLHGAPLPPAPELPVGRHRLHRNRFLDYQLNRLHGTGYARLEDLRAAATHIRGFDDYVRELLALADVAEAEGRLANAAFYVRGAEFFVPPRSPLRRPTYERFLALFDRAFAAEQIERHRVPYGDGVLPASLLRARTLTRKGTVLLFGGFDSLIEEFFGVWSLLAHTGFDVIAFDGPGQGGARCLYGQVFDHDWEKPVGAVLDHFGLERAALIGLSMGGYWALRAAAFEPRIDRVVAWPPVYDWLAPFPAFVRRLIHAMCRRRAFMRWSIGVRMRLAPILRHVVSQTLYIQGNSDDLADVPGWFLGMNAEHLSSARVRQHVLLTCGERDTFQSPKLMRMQARALVNAASVSTRLFTVAEQAEHHCQITNLGLATRVVANWLSTPAEALRSGELDHVR